MDWILAILGDFFPASQLQGDTAEHAEYISSVLVEESLKGSLKREILTEFLSDLVTIDDAQIKGKQLDSVVSQLLSDYASLSISLAQLDLEKDPEPLQGPKKKVISAESSDKALKERLLAQYAFDFDEIVELEDGQLEIITRSEPRTVSGSRSNSDILDDPFLVQNRNADVVKEGELAKRTKAKEEHQKQVARNKELLEKQKLDKEKERKRTQKKEKRRM